MRDNSKRDNSSVILLLSAYICDVVVYNICDRYAYIVNLIIILIG